MQIRLRIIMEAPVYKGGKGIQAVAFGIQLRIGGGEKMYCLIPAHPHVFQRIIDNTALINIDRVILPGIAAAVHEHNGGSLLAELMSQSKIVRRTCSPYDAIDLL